MGPLQTAKPKLTTKQQLVLKAFHHAKRPITPQEAWEEARRELSTLGLATVYRAVQRLLADGLLRHVEIAEAPQLYESTEKPHHHHFYCSKCGQVFEIKACPPKLDALVPPGFTMSDHSITLYGRCANCGPAKD